MTEHKHTVYHVQSHTNKNTVYHVELEPTPYCTCKGFGYRRTCSHITEVILQLSQELPLQQHTQHTQDLQNTLDTASATHSSQVSYCAQCATNALPVTHLGTGICPACTRANTFHTHTTDQRVRQA